MKQIGSMIIAGILLSLSLSQFLMIDDTDTHVYVNGTYVCRDFSRDLIFNASHYHLYLDYVYLPEKQHMITGMYNPITDKMILIEPQNDQILGITSIHSQKYIRISVWYSSQYYCNVGRW